MRKNGEWNSVALNPSDRHHNITRCSRARDIYGDARCTPNRIWSEPPLNVTVLLPCDEPKFVPAIVTDVLVMPEFGESVLI